MNRIFCIVFFIFWGILSCAATNLPTVEEMQSFELEEDEKRLWNRSAEEQYRLENSNCIYDDPVLQEYVNEIAQKLFPEDARVKGLTIEVKVVKNPLLNAFAYPNGVMYVHTGILSKMDNEAQLATLLGHEMSHVTHRHTVENFRSVKNTTAALATVQVAAIPFGVYGSLANLLGTVGAMAAVTGYSRELETEADLAGLKLMVQAGYDPRESPKLFEYLKKDLEEQEIDEPFFFGSHPRLQERLRNYTVFIKTHYPDTTGMVNQGRFMEVITPMLLDNARSDLSMGRYESAKRGIEKFIQRQPDNARGHFFMGEVYRQRGETEDRASAIEAYNQAIRCDPEYPQPYKGLGIVYYKQKNYAESQASFEQYLLLDPETEDKGYIEQYMQRMNSE
jgi:predicted Zn-dependent protease